MPVYEVQIEGKTFEVDAPSPEALQQALGQTQQQRIAARIASNPAEYDASSPEFQERVSPLSGSNFQNFRAGMGKGFVDLARGVGQAVGVGPSREQIDTARERDAALMNTKAGFTGNLAGTVAGAAPTMFIPGANTYTGAALIGAGLGAAGPVGTQDSRLSNAALGAAGGVAGRYLGGKIGDWAAKPRQALTEAEDAMAAQAAARAQSSAQSGGSQSSAGITGTLEGRLRTGGVDFGHVGDDASAGITAMQREVMDRGQALGMRLTPGQASGSKALQQLEAKLESQPMTSGPFNAIKENNARVMAREAAAAIGENADTVDASVIDRAFTRLGNVFDDAADDVAREIEPRQFLSVFQTVQDDLRGIVRGFGDHPLVTDLVELAGNGSATGKQLQSLTSKLGKAAQKEMTSASGDRDLGMGLYAVKDYVDDLLQQGMSGQRAANFAQARTQYRNLINLTSRVGVVNPSTGNVSGRSLANLLSQKDKRGFMRGKNQTGMYNAARFAQAFPSIVGDSGTATRMPFQGIGEMLMRVPYSIAAKAYTSPAAVNVAANAGAASRAVGRAVGRPVRAGLGSLPFYGPFAMPGLLSSTGNVVLPELDRQ